MKVLQKIISLMLLLIFLISTTGYALDHHFCNYCKQVYEHAWFLIPSTIDSNHDCELCHHDHDDKGCEENSHKCHLEKSKHTEFFKIDIISLSAFDSKDIELKPVSMAIMQVYDCYKSIEYKYNLLSFDYHRFDFQFNGDRNVLNCIFLI